MQKFSGGLSKTVSLDFSWAEFLNFLEQKCEEKDKHFVKIDRWFPSSKLCSNEGCGCLNENLKLSDRTFRCGCGLILDRDINAARNIKREGLRLLSSTKGVHLLKKPTGLMSESHAFGDMSGIIRSAEESLPFMTV